MSIVYRIKSKCPNEASHDLTLSFTVLLFILLPSLKYHYSTLLNFAYLLMLSSNSILFYEVFPKFSGRNTLSYALQHIKYFGLWIIALPIHILSSLLNCTLLEIRNYSVCIPNMWNGYVHIMVRGKIKQNLHSSLIT